MSSTEKNIMGMQEPRSGKVTMSAGENMLPSYHVHVRV